LFRHFRILQQLLQRRDGVDRSRAELAEILRGFETHNLVGALQLTNQTLYLLARAGGGLDHLQAAGDDDAHILVRVVHRILQSGDRLAGGGAELAEFLGGPEARRLAGILHLLVELLNPRLLFSNDSPDRHDCRLPL
jgi:hypothetical protein